MHEGGDGSRVALEIAHQASVAADPGERALDDPALRQNDELVRVGSFDDHQTPRSGRCNRACGFRSLIAGVGENGLDERKSPAGVLENQPRPVAILHIVGVDDDVQQQTERIDEHMALAPRDFLSGVEALRIKRKAPFGAALALWLSMIAAVGLASRPAASRTAI